MKKTPTKYFHVLGSSNIKRLRSRGKVYCFYFNSPASSIYNHWVVSTYSRAALTDGVREITLEEARHLAPKAFPQKKVATPKFPRVTCEHA